MKKIHASLLRIDAATQRLPLFREKAVHEDAKATGPLVCLSGVDFRETAINCPHCRWYGSAGQLKVPATPAEGIAVNYACPRCAALVARHPGLTDQEVMQEMERIRKELAAEMASTFNFATVVDGDADLDFDSVRSQIIVTESETESEEAAATLADMETAAPAAEEGIAVANPPVAETAENQLDFAAIRQRMLETN